MNAKLTTQCWDEHQVIEKAHPGSVCRFGDVHKAHKFLSGVCSHVLQREATQVLLQLGKLLRLEQICHENSLLRHVDVECSAGQGVYVSHRSSGEVAYPVPSSFQEIQSRSRGSAESYFYVKVIVILR